MAMVGDFLKNGGCEIEKSEDNSNPFAKINIEEQEIDDDPEDFFNGEKDAQEEEDVFSLEDMDNSEADTDSEYEDVEEYEHQIYWLYLCYIFLLLDLLNSILCISIVNT